MEKCRNLFLVPVLLVVSLSAVKAIAQSSHADRGKDKKVNKTAPCRTQSHNSTDELVSLISELALDKSICDGINVKITEQKDTKDPQKLKLVLQDGLREQCKVSGNFLNKELNMKEIHFGYCASNKEKESLVKNSSKDSVVEGKILLSLGEEQTNATFAVKFDCPNLSVQKDIVKTKTIKEGFQVKSNYYGSNPLIGKVETGFDPTMTTFSHGIKGLPTKLKVDAIGEGTEYGFAADYQRIGGIHDGYLGLKVIYPLDTDATAYWGVGMGATGVSSSKSGDLTHIGGGLQGRFGIDLKSCTSENGSLRGCLNLNGNVFATASDVPAAGVNVSGSLSLEKSLNKAKLGKPSRRYLYIGAGGSAIAGYVTPNDDKNPNGAFAGATPELTIGVKY